jgi:hypothetical protein
MRPVVRRPQAAAVVTDDRVPTGVSIGAGCAAVVAAALPAALISPAHAGWRFAVVAAVVGAFALVARDGRAVTAVAGLAWLIVNGFLVDRLGELSWHGSSDLVRLVGLALIGAIGLAVGARSGGMRVSRARWRVSLELDALLENEEKEWRDA